MTDDGNRLRNEMSRLTKQTVQQTKKYQRLQGNMASLEQDRTRLRQRVSAMERENTLSKKQADADRHVIDNFSREKENLNKSIQEIQKEVRLRTADIVALKKTLREEQAAARKTILALDATRAERNMLHKNYAEALDEIQDLKQKLRMLAYHIEQLNEDISGKETGLESCEGACEDALANCHKKCEQLRAEVRAGLTKLADARGCIGALKREEARLNRIVGEGDVARAKLTKELEGQMNERNAVGAPLVRRNDEVSLLYEKIRVLEVTVHRGREDSCSGL